MNKIEESDNYQLNKITMFSLKLLVLGTTALFFLYQSIELIKLYNSYETVVSISYEDKGCDEIPSLTLCFPTIIDKNKLLLKYTDLSNKLSDNPNDDKRKDILREYLDNAMDSMNWTDLTVHEVEAFNCTLNYWSIKYNSYSESEKKAGLDCRDVVKPIESYSNGKTKCFTYFSRLSEDNNFNGKYSLKYGLKNLNDLNEIIRIQLNLDPDRYLSMPFIENRTTISVHHHNIIGTDESNVQLIDFGYQYDITITKVSTKLLGKPYKTSCYDYIKNKKKNNGIKSRKQCIDKCVIDLYEDKCNCIPIHLANTLQLLNSSQIVCSRKDSSFRSNECYADITREVGLCLTYDRCPHECIDIRYISETKTKKLMTDWEEIRPNVTKDGNEKKVFIRIRLDGNRGHKVVTHVPLMSFGQLLADITAFLLLFTGLSLISLTNLLISWLPTIRMNLKQISDEESDHKSDEQQHRRKVSQFVLTEKDPNNTLIEEIIDSSDFTKRQIKIGNELRRPATSITVY